MLKIEKSNKRFENRKKTRSNNNLKYQCLLVIILVLDILNNQLKNMQNISKRKCNNRRVVIVLLGHEHYAEVSLHNI